MAHNYSLQASVRTITGKRVRRLRVDGKIPAVIYGPVVTTPVPVIVEERELMRTYQAVGNSTLIDVNVDGESYTVYMRDIQRHPVKRRPLHAEFFAPNLRVAMTAHIPIHLNGEPRSSNLVVMHTHDWVELRGLPANLPSSIEVDISGLEAVDDSIFVRDLVLPEGVELLTDGDELIVRLTEPQLVEEEEAEAGEEAAEEAASGRRAGRIRTNSPAQNDMALQGRRSASPFLLPLLSMSPQALKHSPTWQPVPRCLRFQRAILLRYRRLQLARILRRFAVQPFKVVEISLPGVVLAACPQMQGLAYRREQRLRDPFPGIAVGNRRDARAEGRRTSRVQECLDRRGHSPRISRRNGNTNTFITHEIGQHIPVGRNHRQTTPQVIQDSCPKREACLDGRVMQRERHVRLQQPVVSFSIGRPLVEKDVAVEKAQPLRQALGIIHHASSQRPEHLDCAFP